MPILFFKFLSINDKKHLERVIKIINEHRIYFPKKYKLNDPMEGCFAKYRLAYAGESITAATESEDPILMKKRKANRILSLSESCFIPQLWAYYADNYSGICLCFHSQGEFKSANKIEYKSSDEYNRDFFENYDNESIKSSFLIKEEGWKHEKEWRIVKKSKSKYFDYDKSDLAAVIFGSKVKPSKKKRIIANLPVGFPIYNIHICAEQLKLFLLEQEADIKKDGSTPNFIRNTDELYERIKNKGY